MILSRDIGFATALVLTACAAGSIGYYAGSTRAIAPHQDLGPIVSTTQTRSNTGFAGPLATEVVKMATTRTTTPGTAPAAAAAVAAPK